MEGELMKLIAGPCQHESIGKSGEIADHLFDLCKKYEIEYYFKASFDKANRTSDNKLPKTSIEQPSITEASTTNWSSRRMD